MLTQLAEGTVTRQDVDKSTTDSRSLETQFILEDTRDEGQNGVRYIFLSINTHHDKDRKRYVTRVSRIFRDGYVNRWAFSFDMYEDRQPVPDYALPVARHSVKALRETHEEHLAEYMKPENFAALIDWASRAETRD